tara:strand:- start:2820 stop:3029 length:210 start_codon:yes stop_codon:yes gene_type:complete
MRGVGGDSASRPAFARAERLIHPGQLSRGIARRPSIHPERTRAFEFVRDQRLARRVHTAHEHVLVRGKD